MISIIIPLGPEDGYGQPLRGAGEVIVAREGSVASARNIGGRKAKFDELLFLDADIILPKDLDVSKLGSYDFKMATAFYKSQDPLESPVSLYQNFLASIGHPFGFFGGLMYMKKSVFEDVGGFRECPGEDVEFAQRAWLKGYRIDVFPFEVIHARHWHWKNLVGPLLSSDWVWGIP